MIRIKKCAVCGYPEEYKKKLSLFERVIGFNEFCMNCGFKWTDDLRTTEEKYNVKKFLKTIK